MDCKFAYLKDKIEYLLCRKEAEPDVFDRAGIAHSVCIHQVHCPRQNCHKNSPGWVNCAKLAEKPEKPAPRQIEAEPVAEPAEKKSSSNRRRKAKTEDIPNEE